MNPFSGLIAAATRRRGLAALAAALLLPFSAASCRRQPERPLELTLTLVKTRLKPHDAMWYILGMKNVGRKDVFVSDEFWANQHALTDNLSSKHGTYFEVLGPEGKAFDPDSGWLGFHGELDYWTNPHSPSQYLRAGQTIRVTPSVVATIRARNRDDLRRGPPGRQRDYIAAMARRESESEKKLPGWLRMPLERPAWAPPEARIMTDFDFALPGKYRIRAVYSPISQEAAAREIKSGRLWLGGLPPETRIFRFESPWVEFEVTP